eukprot:943012-Amphidinium_carterae.1
MMKATYDNAMMIAEQRDTRKSRSDCSYEGERLFRHRPPQGLRAALKVPSQNHVLGNLSESGSPENCLFVPKRLCYQFLCRPELTQFSSGILRLELA